MKMQALHSWSDDELIARFVDIALAQDHALMDEETETYSRLYQDMQAVRGELRVRPGDRRRVLIQLFDHENPNVRLMAAKSVLALEPERARHVLQDLHDRQVFLYGGSAGMTLWMLDSGRYVPT